MNNTTEEVKQMNIDPVSIFQPLFEDYKRVNFISSVLINKEVERTDDVQLETYLYKAGGDIISTIEQISVDLCNLLVKYGRDLDVCDDFNNIVIFTPEDDKKRIDKAFPSIAIIPDNGLVVPRYVSQDKFPISAVVLLTEESAEVTYYCDGDLFEEWCTKVDCMQPKYRIAEFLRKELEDRVADSKLESFTIHIDTDKFNELSSSKDLVLISQADGLVGKYSTSLNSGALHHVLNITLNVTDLEAVVKEDGTGYLIVK